MGYRHLDSQGSAGRSSRAGATAGAPTRPAAADDRFSLGSTGGGTGRSLRRGARGPDRCFPQAFGISQASTHSLLSLAAAAGIGTAGEAAPAPYPSPEAERDARGRLAAAIAGRVGRGTRGSVRS